MHYCTLYLLSNKRDKSKKRRDSATVEIDDSQMSNEHIPNAHMQKGESTGKGLWGIWPFNMLEDRPILRLFLVIFFNGILTNIFSTIFLNIEKPAQDVSLLILGLELFSKNVII